MAEQRLRLQHTDQGSIRVCRGYRTMLTGMRRIGTAGWTIGSSCASHFPNEGTHLERYACQFNAVEVNSSFYRPHRRSTYHRWAATVPTQFRFSVKIPKVITHDHRLENCDDLINRFADEVQGLGEKFRIALVQMPPSLVFSEEQLQTFEQLRNKLGASIQCEPRHLSWFAPHVEKMLAEMGIGRVAADPPPVVGADHPGKGGSISYFRLHGAPRIYWSRYERAALEAWSTASSKEISKNRESWVIFDNTAAGFALDNALEFQAHRY